LDESNPSVDITHVDMFSYNSNKTASLGPSSADYVLESKDGTDVTFNLVKNSTPVNWTVNLATADSDGAGGHVMGNRGRRFVVGDHVTATAGTLTVSGRLTTEQPAGAQDSYFEIASGGTVSLSNVLTLDNADFFVRSGGTLSVAQSQASLVQSGANLNIDGSATFVSGLYINSGGTVSVGSTGTFSGYMTLTGGRLNVDGTLQGATGGMFDLNSNGGTLYVGAGADLSKVSAFNLYDNGTTNLISDMTIGTFRTIENKTATLNIADGHTLTVTTGNNFKEGSNTTINGDIALNKNMYLSSGTTVTIASGTVTVGDDGTAGASTFGNSAGTVNIGAGAMLYLKNPLAAKDMQGTAHTNLAGTVNVSGTLKLKSTNKNSYAGVVKGNLSVLSGGELLVENTSTTWLGIGDGGTLFVADGGALTTQQVIFKTDSSATAARSFVLASGASYANEIIALRSKNNTVQLGYGEDYVFSRVAFHSNISGAENEMTIDLNGASGLEISLLSSYGSSAALGKLIIRNFDANLVKIDNFDDDIISALNENGVATVNTFLTLHLQAYDVYDNLLDNTTGQWLLQDGFLSHSLIPEPSQWAALLGLLALGFAAYRRRK
ncbi:MAG: PEP-CTERM sorting domain-containing protein, partial [Opitutales bacterium]|nr:PEP-CTERM sorting domain-containing protein [Opitutales bacterium]